MIADDRHTISRWFVGDLTLPEGLEGEYDRRQDDASRRQTVVVLVVTIILSLLGLGADAIAGILHEALAFKFLFQFPIALAGIFFVLRRGLSSRWLWLAGTIPIATTVVIVNVLGTQTEPMMASRYVTIAGLTAVITNVALPIKVRHALAVSLLNVTLLLSVPLFFYAIRRRRFLYRHSAVHERR